MAKIVLILLALGLLALAACEAAPTQPPLLPPGFETALFPGQPLEGFGYASQGQPLVVPGSSLGLPLDISLTEAAGVLLPSGTLAGWLNFSSPAVAQVVGAVLPIRGGLEKVVQGTQVLVARGSDGTGLLQGKWVRLQDKVPQEMRLLWRLPSQPPAPSVAVGLVRVGEPLFKVLEESRPGQSKQLGDILKKARAEYLIGAVYSEKPLLQVTGAPLSQVKEMGISFLLIAKSSYPSLALGTVWKPLAQGVGFKKKDFSGQEIFHLNQQGWDVVLRVKGSHIYLAGAPTLEASAALLASAINK